MERRCDNEECSRIATDLKRCGNCKSVWYCDETCQRQSYDRHKRVCPFLKESTDEPPQDKRDIDTIIDEVMEEHGFTSNEDEEFTISSELSSRDAIAALVTEVVNRINAENDQSSESEDETDMVLEDNSDNDNEEKPDFNGGFVADPNTSEEEQDHQSHRCGPNCLIVPMVQIAPGVIIPSALLPDFLEFVRQILVSKDDVEPAKYTVPEPQSEANCKEGEESCIICTERAISTLIEPCKHKVLCINCSIGMKEKNIIACPICRTNIEAIKSTISV